MSETEVLTENKEIKNLKESIFSIKHNIQILEELIEREKENVLKLKQVKDLSNKRDLLLKKLQFNEECLFYETEKTSFNEKPLQSSDKGRNCVCFYNNTWTTGRIIQVNEDYTVDVLLNGYFTLSKNENLQVNLKYIHVKPNKKYAYDEKDVFKGMILEAIYKEDGEYYQAEVVNVCKDYIEVGYLGYNSTERLEFDMVRLVPSLKIENLKRKAENEKEKQRRLDEVKSDLKFVFPESLKVTINDDEEERKMKRKKLNALKLNHKEKILEHVSNKKKESWLDFQEEMKSKFGFKAGERKEGKEKRR